MNIKGRKPSPSKYDVTKYEAVMRQKNLSGYLTKSVFTTTDTQLISNDNYSPTFKQYESKSKDDLETVKPKSESIFSEIKKSIPDPS